jgi:hypothetical protein
MTVYRLPFACWIPKAKNTPSECVILIVLPLLQWLHERGSFFRYTYFTCLCYYSTELLRKEEKIACSEMIACEFLETVDEEKVFFLQIHIKKELYLNNVLPLQSSQNSYHKSTSTGYTNSICHSTVE